MKWVFFISWIFGWYWNIINFYKRSCFLVPHQALSDAIFLNVAFCFTRKFVAVVVWSGHIYNFFRQFVRAFSTSNKFSKLESFLILTSWVKYYKHYYFVRTNLNVLVTCNINAMAEIFCTNFLEQLLVDNVC